MDFPLVFFHLLSTGFYQRLFHSHKIYFYRIIPTVQLRQKTETPYEFPYSVYFRCRYFNDIPCS